MVQRGAQGGRVSADKMPVKEVVIEVFSGMEVTVKSLRFSEAKFGGDIGKTPDGSEIIHQVLNGALVARNGAVHPLFSDQNRPQNTGFLTQRLQIGAQGFKVRQGHEFIKRGDDNRCLRRRSRHMYRCVLGRICSHAPNMAKFLLNFNP